CLATEAKPEQQRDQRRVRLVQLDELIAECPVAPEQVDATARNLGLDDAPIHSPEHRGGDPGWPWVGSRLARANDHVYVTGRQRRKEPRGNFRRILEICGENGKII